MNRTRKHTETVSSLEFYQEQYRKISLERCPQWRGWRRGGGDTATVSLPFLPRTAPRARVSRSSNLQRKNLILLLSACTVSRALSNRSRELRDNVAHAWNISECFYCDRVPHPDWYALVFASKKFCPRVVCLKRPCGPLPAPRLAPRARGLRRSSDAASVKVGDAAGCPPWWHPSTHSLEQLAGPTTDYMWLSKCVPTACFDTCQHHQSWNLDLLLEFSTFQLYKVLSRIYL